MLIIYGNDSMRIKKSLLSKGKGNIMLFLVFTVLILVPFKVSFLHWEHLNIDYFSWQY